MGERLRTHLTAYKGSPALTPVVKVDTTSRYYRYRNGAGSGGEWVSMSRPGTIPIASQRYYLL